ncbi:MAG: TetR/AcrR family transcriptional regulator [Eggerthellaceae bacterium]
MRKRAVSCCKARSEFLDKGYEKASLRSIAQNAGVTTGALYVRFPNKSALFAALVEPVSAHLLGLFRTGNDQGFEQLDEGRPEDMWSTSEDVITRIVDYIFEHKEPFDLLINHAAGSGYEHFLDDLVEEEVSQSLAYLDAMRERGLACASPSHDDLHALVSAEYYAFFEIVRRHLERGRRCAHQTHRRLLPPRLGEPLRRVMPSFHDH